MTLQLGHALIVSCTRHGLYYTKTACRFETRLQHATGIHLLCRISAWGKDNAAGLLWPSFGQLSNPNPSTIRTRDLYNEKYIHSEYAPGCNLQARSIHAATSGLRLIQRYVPFEGRPPKCTKWKTFPTIPPRKTRIFPIEQRLYRSVVDQGMAQ